MLPEGLTEWIFLFPWDRGLGSLFRVSLGQITPFTAASRTESIFCVCLGHIWNCSGLILSLSTQGSLCQCFRGLYSVQGWDYDWLRAWHLSPCDILPFNSGETCYSASFPPSCTDTSYSAPRNWADLVWCDLIKRDSNWRLSAGRGKAWSFDRQLCRECPRFRKQPPERLLNT